MLRGGLSWSRQKCAELTRSSPLRSILSSPRASRAGSVESDASQPDTPKKRVRYADEEDLPLESFKDASPE
jgi:hypothetical protein